MTIKNWICGASFHSCCQEVTKIYPCGKAICGKADFYLVTLSILFCFSDDDDDFPVWWLLLGHLAVWSEMCHLGNECILLVTK